MGLGELCALCHRRSLPLMQCLPELSMDFWRLRNTDCLVQVSESENTMDFFAK